MGAAYTAAMFAPAPSAAADLLLLPSALLDALSDPVLVIGPDARLERLNRAALRRLALEPGTALADLRPVLGDRLHARLHAPHHTSQRRIIEPLTRGRQ